MFYNENHAKVDHLTGVLEGLKKQKWDTDTMEEGLISVPDETTVNVADPATHTVQVYKAGVLRENVKNDLIILNARINAIERQLEEIIGEPHEEIKEIEESKAARKTRALQPATQEGISEDKEDGNGREGSTSKSG